MSRIPWADRPEVVTEFCQCTWVHHEVNKKPVLRHIHMTHPECPLHGDDVQPSPF